MGPHTYQAKAAALELYDATDLDPVVWHELTDNGVDYDHILHLAGPVCRQPVTFYDGVFDYDRLGENAFLLVVMDEDAETEVDIVAWSIRAPDVFGTLLGRAGLLGADRVVNPASYTNGPCPLWRNPLRWLQANSEGAVVISAYPASVTLAKACGQLSCESLEHGRTLVKAGALTPPQLVIRKPQIERWAA